MKMYFSQLAKTLAKGHQFAVSLDNYRITFERKTRLP